MSPITLSHLTFRSILYYTVIVSGVALLLGYAVFQARFLIAGPQISLTSDLQNTYSERLITLEGHAENITHITLNGRQIYTDKTGYFKEALILENGYTVATLRAEDRYGRETTLSQQFVYTPEEPQIN